MPLKPVYYWHWISGQGDLMRKMPGLIDGWATGKVPWAKCLSRLNLSLALFFSLALYCPLAINCSPRPARFMQVPKLLLPQHILTSAPINILIPTMLGIRKVIWVSLVCFLEMELFLLEATCCYFYLPPSPLLLYPTTSTCYSPISYCLFYQS